MEKYKAFGDWVFFEKINETTTKGGLLLTDDDGDPVQMGTVISVGEKAKDQIEIKEGDTIFFLRHEATEFVFLGKNYLKIKWTAIMAIYEK